MKICDLYDDAVEEIENEFLTPKEVMNLLYIGRNTFYKMVNSGELPAFRVGKLWRVRRDDLYSFLSKSDLLRKRLKTGIL